MFDAREFLTVPSVEAARLSETTIETTSCTCTAFISVESRVRRPFALQREPGVRTSAALSARTRSIYVVNATSGGVGFEFILGIPTPHSGCARTTTMAVTNKVFMAIFHSFFRISRFRVTILPCQDRAPWPIKQRVRLPVVLEFACLARPVRAQSLELQHAMWSFPRLT